MNEDWKTAWSSTPGADLYEHGRPGYATEALPFIGRQLKIGPSSRIVDLGAGTGKLTRQLLNLTSDIIAVEPLEGMRTTLSQALPEIEVRAGFAEAIPLGNASTDAIFAGQAWHWFDRPRAVAEISRVLKPGGSLILLWNQYDRSQPWVNEYAELRDSEGKKRRVKDETLAIFARLPGWTPVTKRTFRHIDNTTRSGVLDRMLSTSSIAALYKDEQTKISSRIIEILDRYPETRQDPINVPYLTEVFWTTFGQEQ